MEYYKENMGTFTNYYSVDMSNGISHSNYPNNKAYPATQITVGLFNKFSDGDMIVDYAFNRMEKITKDEFSDAKNKLLKVIQ